MVNENVRKRSNIELISNNNKRLLKCVSDPTYKRATTFHENLLVAVRKSKRILKLNKPIIVGFCILELSKTHMYDFWYNTLKKRYGDNIHLLFTDTDSLCYSVQTDDLYKDIEEMNDLYDTSDFPKDHFLYSKFNKKVIGNFKPEFKDKLITEVIAPTQKCYSVLLEDEENPKDQQKH